MLATRLRYLSVATPGMYVPVGAIGYYEDGSVAVPVHEEGWLYAPAGQVVFRDPMNYGVIPHTLHKVEIFGIAPGGSGGGGASSANRGAGGAGAGGHGYDADFTLPSYFTLNLPGPPGGGAPDNHGTTAGPLVLDWGQLNGGGYGARGKNEVTPEPGGDGGCGGGGGDHAAGTSSGGIGSQGYNGAPRVSSGGSGGGGSGGGGIGGPGQQSTTVTGAEGGSPITLFGYQYGRGGRGGDMPVIGVSGLPGRPYSGDGGGGGKRQDWGRWGGSGCLIIRWGGYGKNLVHLIGDNVSVNGNITGGNYAIAETQIRPVNASGLTRANGKLVVDIMTSDPANLHTDSQFAITSSGGPDVNEWTLTNVPSLGLTTTWKTFVIPLSQFQEFGAPVDVSNINYLRYYNYINGGAPDTSIHFRNAHLVY